jgi:hypothetical protein
MAAEVAAREARLQRQIEALSIEIDERKRVRQVAEITGTDYFRDLRRRGHALRGQAAAGPEPEAAAPGSPAQPPSADPPAEAEGPADQDPSGPEAPAGA